MSLLRPLCKYAARVTIVQDIIPTLREAIFIAQSNTPGPVFVELPIGIFTIQSHKFYKNSLDVIYPYNLVAREAGITPGFGFKVLFLFLLSVSHHLKFIHSSHLIRLFIPSINTHFYDIEIGKLVHLPIP